MKLFKKTGIIPYNNEDDNQFIFESKMIRQTYLKASQGITFIRKRSGQGSSQTFDYETRYEIDNQRVQKKRILAEGEYGDLMMTQIDPNRRELNILRTSFMYDTHYFQLETITNIEGCPTFLTCEQHAEGNNHINIPPFIQVMRDVTGENEYQTKNMAKLDFKMGWE